MSRRILLPREHGAWGILLQPFLAAAVLSREWTWFLIPAMVAILTVFVAREPLLILARQRYLWREPKPEADLARKHLQVEAAILAACGLALLAAVPAAPLVVLGVVAAVLTSVAIYMALRNRQRSVLLQIVSAFGLGSSALLAGYVARGASMEPRTWLLWGILSLHFLIGIFVVHTRLDKRAHKPGERAMAGLAILFIAVSAVSALACIANGKAMWSLPLLLSALVSSGELVWLQRTEALAEPLKRVGWRALSASVVHTVLTVAVLW